MSFLNSFLGALIVLAPSCAAQLMAAPIHDAAEKGDVEESSRLIDEGADVDARTRYGDTPLHYATRRPTTGTCSDRTRPDDASGLTEGHRKVVELLLQAGAASDLRNSDGTTPLQNAAQCNDLEIAKLLIASGANVNNRGGQYSVLDMAVYWGPEVAKLLIESGVEVNTVTPYSGGTPLHAAIARRKQEVARLLLEHGAAVAARHTEYLDSTPSHYAARACEPELIALLLEYGADTNAEDEQGRTADQIAQDCSE